MTGPIARGVIRAETLQRLAEEDGGHCPDNRPLDFTERWAVYAHLHMTNFDVPLRHEAHTRQQDQRVKCGASHLGEHQAEQALQRMVDRIREAAPCAA